MNVNENMLFSLGFDVKGQHKLSTGRVLNPKRYVYHSDTPDVIIYMKSGGVYVRRLGFDYTFTIYNYSDDFIIKIVEEYG